MTETPANTPESTLEDESEKTFSLEYVSKLRSEAAEYRTKAKANADAAEELAQIKEANKTEAEKAAERLAELESENLTLKTTALRLEIANKFGISNEKALLFLNGTDEETLTKQAEQLAALVPEKKPFGSYVPSEGKNPTPGDGNELREVARQIFHRN